MRFVNELETRFPSIEIISDVPRLITLHAWCFFFFLFFLLFILFTRTPYAYARLKILYRVDCLHDCEDFVLQSRPRNTKFPMDSNRPECDGAPLLFFLFLFRHQPDYFFFFFFSETDSRVPTDYTPPSIGTYFPTGFTIISAFAFLSRIVNTLSIMNIVK